MPRVLLGLLLVTTACRRTDPTMGIAHDPAADARPDASVEVGSDAAADTIRETEVAAFPFDRESALDAVRSLSPTWKRLTVGRKGGPNPAIMAEITSADCAATDPECEWIVSMGVTLPERFWVQDGCRVHAHTGIVRCPDSAQVLKPIGKAKLRPADAGAK